MVVLFTKLFLWENWLEYYWDTDVINLYQSADSFRLCEGENQLFPVWTPNDEYYLHIPKAEQAMSEGKPITIIARGIISDANSEVYVDTIIDIIVGVNENCEEG